MKRSLCLFVCVAANGLFSFEASAIVRVVLQKVFKDVKIPWIGSVYATTPKI